MVENNGSLIYTTTNSNKYVEFGFDDESSNRVADGIHYGCAKYPHRYLYNFRTNEKMPYYCGSWDCPTCSVRKLREYVDSMERWGVFRGLDTFVTLTLSPREISSKKLSGLNTKMDLSEEALEGLLCVCSGEVEQKNRIGFFQGDDVSREILQYYYAKYISYLWNKLRTRLVRDYGKFSYIVAKEFHKDNVRPHLHIVMNLPNRLSDDMLKEHLVSAGFGVQADVTRLKQFMDEIDPESKYAGNGLFSYITKYMGKEMCDTEGKIKSYPKTIRRFSTSRTIKLAISPFQWYHRDKWLDSVDAKLFVKNMNHKCINGKMIGDYQSLAYKIKTTPTLDVLLAMNLKEFGDFMDNGLLKTIEIPVPFVLDLDMEKDKCEGCLFKRVCVENRQSKNDITIFDDSMPSIGRKWKNPVIEYEMFVGAWGSGEDVERYGSMSEELYRVFVEQAKLIGGKVNGF